MTDNLQKMLDHCVEYATDLLTETGECYPYGAWLDTIENVHPLEMEIDPKKIPNIGDVMEYLEKYCKTEIAAKKMNGYALCYEVGYTLDKDEGEQKSNCSGNASHKRRSGA